ncbi:MAG: ABC transporter ATP-binding protein [Candidatus Bipolaricaulia bacterium]
MLSAEGLTLHYGHQRVLDEVGVEVAQSEILAVLGGNAAGKTTLLRALAGLARPERGRVRFRDEDITPLPAHRRVARGLAFGPAERQLFPEMTVRENLEMGTFAHGPDATLTDEDLAEVVELFPVLGDRERQRAGSLSGGEQKMVAIGRALLSRPSLLMLDEPSLGLAGEMKATMARALQALAETDLTVLLTEQDVALAARLADRAMTLERGRVVEHG